MTCNSTRCMMAPEQQGENWKIQTVTIPAADSRLCPGQHQPLQPSLQHFPGEQGFNCLVPVSAESSSGFINSTLLSLTRGAGHDHVKQIQFCSHHTRHGATAREQVPLFHLVHRCDLTLLQLHS